jgi:hypothetical protein
VYHCDAAVAKIEEYQPFASLEEFHGRGGTEYSDALIKLREQWPQPSLLIGFTDGYGGIERYTRLVTSERGEAAYNAFLEASPTCSPDGIETLWLIPEGCMQPDAFKQTIVPWGAVQVIPRDSDR